MNFQEQSALYRGMIEHSLHTFLPRVDRVSLAASVLESMAYSLLAGGKRIRAMLVLGFCALCGGDAADALPFACAVEMVHAYSLIHDDLPCMDDDDLRRGKPTNHKIYGEAIALLAGDGLLTLAFEAALSFGDPSVAARAARTLAQHAGARETGMVGGQCIDLQTEGKPVGMDELQKMDMGKTVALISAAAQMGCLAAGANDEQLVAAREYACGLGMAFQIRDDLLDVLGDVHAMGKNVGMDEARDKRNYVTLLGVEKAQELVDQYTRDALDALNHFQNDTSFLAQLARELAQRTS